MGDRSLPHFPHYPVTGNDVIVPSTLTSWAKTQPRSICTHVPAEFRPTRRRLLTSLETTRNAVARARSAAHIDASCRCDGHRVATRSFNNLSRRRLTSKHYRINSITYGMHRHEVGVVGVDQEEYKATTFSARDATLHLMYSTNTDLRTPFLGRPLTQNCCNLVRRKTPQAIHIARLPGWLHIRILVAHCYHIDSCIDQLVGYFPLILSKYPFPVSPK